MGLVCLNLQHEWSYFNLQNTQQRIYAKARLHLNYFYFLHLWQPNLPLTLLTHCCLTKGVGVLQVTHKVWNYNRLTKSPVYTGVEKIISTEKKTVSLQKYLPIQDKTKFHMWKKVIIERPLVFGGIEKKTNWMVKLILKFSFEVVVF